MQPLTHNGNIAVENLSQRYGVSVDAVKTLLFAVSAGGGTMAQFYHSELGGGGQWMRGGMTMVGDMFNHGLQATVANLCSELSTLLDSEEVFFKPTVQPGTFGGFGNSWWPADLGHPASSGGQNDARYAYFPQPRRLAIDRSGQVTVYDTLDHQIGGVQQQQGGSSGTLSFSSQFGTFTVDSLPIVSGTSTPSSSGAPMSSQAPLQDAAPAAADSSVVGGTRSHAEILGTIERLNDLHKKGILSDDEFRSKKAELLGRL